MRAVISIKTIKTMGTQSILAAKVPENERNKLEKKKYRSRGVKLGEFEFQL